MDEKETKIIVAMSGGVDSSVAAALLKKEGYEVAGVFMRFWSESRIERGSSDTTLISRGSEIPRIDADHMMAAERRGTENLCCSEGAQKAARAVAAKLKIPFYVLDFSKEFKKEVVDNFLKETAAGRTPNPCVVCNKKIKFGVMFEKALALGADYLATGHYARIKRDVILSPKGEESSTYVGNGVSHSSASLSLQRGEREILRRFAPQDDRAIYKLFKAEDTNKDQSYFLHQLTQKQLARVVFPLGEYTKDDVYRLAKKWRLPYRKDESFDLCFVSNDAESFVRRHLKLRPGRIMKYVDLSLLKNLPQPLPASSAGQALKEGGHALPNGRTGEDLGEHQGLALYTIGQRKRLPIGQGPWWVVGKDEKENILYVSDDEKDLYSKSCIVNGLNWVMGASLKFPAKVWVKIRYKSEASEAAIFNPPSPLLKGGNIVKTPLVKGGGGGLTLRLEFKKPQRAITPGQSAVFYDKKGEVLGGGVIDE